MDRRSRSRVVLLIWLAGFFAVGYGVWSFQAGHLMLLLYLAAAILAYGVRAFAARCPHCRMPVRLRPLRLFGAELFLWTILEPNQCRHCGRPLDRARTGPGISEARNKAKGRQATP